MVLVQNDQIKFERENFPQAARIYVDCGPVDEKRVFLEDRYVEIRFLVGLIIQH